MSNYKIVKENDKLNFVSINLEKETILLNEGYRKISDENFSFVYDIEVINLSEYSKKKPLVNGNNDFFYVVMQDSYINYNFFNVTVEFESHFGQNNSRITVFLENTETNKKGRVDRKNQGEAVRIYIGPDYQKWAKQNFKPGDLMKVEVFPNATIRLSK